MWVHYLAEMTDKLRTLLTAFRLAKNDRLCPNKHVQEYTPEARTRNFVNYLRINENTKQTSVLTP